MLPASRDRVFGRAASAYRLVVVLEHKEVTPAISGLGDAKSLAPPGGKDTGPEPDWAAT
jgi:hypothetical protein